MAPEKDSAFEFWHSLAVRNEGSKGTNGFLWQMGKKRQSFENKVKLLGSKSSLNGAD